MPPPTVTSNLPGQLTQEGIQFKLIYKAKHRFRLIMDRREIHSSLLPDRKTHTVKGMRTN